MLVQVPVVTASDKESLSETISTYLSAMLARYQNDRANYQVHCIEDYLSIWIEQSVALSVGKLLLEHGFVKLTPHYTPSVASSGYQWRYGVSVLGVSVGRLFDENDQLGNPEMYQIANDAFEANGSLQQQFFLNNLHQQAYCYANSEITRLLAVYQLHVKVQFPAFPVSSASCHVVMVGVDEATRTAAQTILMRLLRDQGISQIDIQTAN